MSNFLLDAGLQPERTGLAWRRTGISLLIGAVAAARILSNAFGWWAVAPVAFWLAGAVTVLLQSQQRYARTQRALVGSASEPLPSGALLLLTAILVAIGAVTAIALTLYTQLSG